MAVILNEAQFFFSKSAGTHGTVLVISVLLVVERKVPKISQCCSNATVVVFRFG